MNSAPSAESPPPVELLSVYAVLARLSVSRGQIYKLIKQGRFPPPVYVTPAAPRWRSDEIEHYIAGLTTVKAAA